jgi:hypothetical protein
MQKDSNNNFAKLASRSGPIQKANLFPNTGRFTKGDREKQNAQSQRKNQDVCNAFHIKIS